jgi:DNA-3-methyladenine glycosylase
VSFQSGKNERFKYVLSIIELIKMAKKLDKNFFERSPKAVAKDLVGKVLVHRLETGEELAGMIQETAAYSKPMKMITKNYEGMCQEAGRIHIFDYRGNKFLNISTVSGEPSVVHIYKLFPIRGSICKRKNSYKFTNGPGKLTKAFKIEHGYNGSSIYRGNLWIEDEGFKSGVKEVKNKKLATICLGHYQQSN